MKHRICRCAVTAAVTANRRFWRWVFPRNQAFSGLVTRHGYQAWLQRNSTFWSLRKPQFPAAGFQAGFHGNLSKPDILDGTQRPGTQLVRTESDGTGHAGAGDEVVKGLHPALLRPSGLMRPVRACAKRAGHAGAGAAMRHKVFV